MKFLHGVDEIHDEEDNADPECRHGHEDKPLPDCLLPVVRRGEHHAGESHQVAQLKYFLDKGLLLVEIRFSSYQGYTLENAGDRLEVADVPPEIDLDVSLSDLGVGLKFHPPH